MTREMSDDIIHCILQGAAVSPFCIELSLFSSRVENEISDIATKRLELYQLTTGSKWRPSHFDD